MCCLLGTFYWPWDLSYFADDYQLFTDYRDLLTHSFTCMQWCRGAWQWLNLDLQLMVSAAINLYARVIMLVSLYVTDLENSRDCWVSRTGGVCKQLCVFYCTVCRAIIVLHWDWSEMMFVNTCTAISKPHITHTLYCWSSVSLLYLVTTLRHIHLCVVSICWLALTKRAKMLPESVAASVAAYRQRLSEETLSMRLAGSCRVLVSICILIWSS